MENGIAVVFVLFQPLLQFGVLNRLSGVGSNRTSVKT